MIDNKYENKLKSFEKYYKEHPKKYKFKLLLIAFLGYAFMFALLLICLLVIVPIIYLMIKHENFWGLFIISMPILLYFIIIKSIFFKFKKPLGIYLKRKDNKELYQMIDTIKGNIKTKKIHHIVLNEELNAGMYQHPRLGIFGLYTNYLIIGLPLFLAVNTNELKAIISHELGHLSCNHSKYSLFIYRLKNTWDLFYEYLNMSNSKLISKFIDWYIPLFDAYAFIIIREHEYVADKIASSYTSPIIYSQAITKLGIASFFMEKIFYKEIYKQAINNIEPVDNLYDELLNSFKTRLDKEYIVKFQTDLLEEKTQYIDTHPSLKDRISALNTNIHVNVDFTYNSLNIIEQNNINIYFTKYNKTFVKNINKWWKDTYHDSQVKKQKLEDLLKYEEYNELSLTEKYQKAFLIEKVKSEDEALEIYKNILKDNNYLPAQFSIGRIFLNKDNKEGIKYIEYVTSKDLRYINEGYRLIYNYLISCYKNIEAKMYLQKFNKFQKTYKKAIIERDNISNNNKFINHNLNNDDISNIKEQLSKYPLINDVYLAIKKVKYFKEYPFFTIFINFQDISKEKQVAIINKIANNLVFPGEFIIVPLNKILNNKLKKIENSKII